MNEIPDQQRWSGPIWLLRSLEPLLIEPPGSYGGSLWWRHAPFGNWVLAHAKPRHVSGEGEALQGLQELALMVGQTTEWGGAAASAPIDCLVLDGSWAEGETGVVLARWRPRLAPGAAVLVHGINFGQGGSLLWRDLGREHPGALRFELPQGAGLGLLLPESAASPTVLRDLCELPPKATADFKTLCAVLGARWAAGQQIATARREAAELGASVNAARRRNEELRRRIDRLEREQVAVLAAERAVLAAERAALGAERAARQSERAARQAERAHLVAKMQMTAQRMKSAHVEELARMSAQAESAAAQMTAAHAAEIHRRSAATEAMLSQAAEAHAAALALLASRAEAVARQKAEIHAKAIARLWARARAAEGALAEIAASTSWRATRRIIRAASWLPNSWRVAGRRSLRLAWWTVTGRLVARLRHRRRTQRALALLRASPLFDPLWYARAYPDVALSGLDPTAHFAAHGAAENRDAGPAFDARWYRQRYPDVAAARIHPLLHFLQHGAAEGREWRAVVPALPDPPPSKIPVPAGPAIPEADVVPETPDENRAAAYALPEKPAVPPASVNASLEFAAALPEISADDGSEPPPSFAEAQFRVAEPAAPEEVPPQPEAEELPAIVPRLELLGRDLPEITIFPVTVGFVIRCTPPGDLRRALESAETALEAIGQRRHASIMLAGHDATVDLADFVSWTVARLPPGTAPGLAAAHNRIMECAFAAGAEVYLTAHPGGVFHPEALIAVMRMVRANGRRALVEAARAPRKVPRPVDPECYAIPWISGACLAIPRQVYDAVGGFDERLEPWGADLDFSWRAKAAGFDLLACPDALFELSFTDEEKPVPPAFLSSAVLLARKWGLAELEVELAAQLERAGERLPEDAMEMVPGTARAAADLRGGPFFGDRLW